MCPFTVTVEHVPDRELGPLLTRPADAGFNNPTINHVDADGFLRRRLGPRSPLDLPEIGGSCGSATASPIGGRTSAIATVPAACSSARRAPKAPFQIGLGETVRKNKWGATESAVAF